jgi:hypothetical protein
LTLISPRHFDLVLATLSGNRRFAPRPPISVPDNKLAIMHSLPDIQYSLPSHHLSKE